MKNLKKVLALVLAVVMVMGAVVTTSAAYKDVKDTDTYANAIDVLSNIGILDGFEDGTFKADGTLTRAQAAKIVAIVHNAKTNGWIDTDIDELYANAQNPFVDCNNSWALPYINYCRITGLADGMTATTYEPNRVLTGVQFLKLMLTTLGFDTAKEGYTGTGWDINVLNRANEIGLLAGLATGWKAIAPVTRGEAAQILYNALSNYVVEYGQKVTNTYVDDTTLGKYYKASFISNEVVKYGDAALAELMGVGYTNAYDVFMRPGIMWSYGTWSAFYAKAATKTYTGKVSACDVLVDLGVAKTSNSTLKALFFRNGRLEYSDGYVTMNHTADHVAGSCDTTPVGETGALTQIFKMKNKAGETVYFINVIDTFLAKVTNVTTSLHHSDNVATATLDVYAPNVFADPTEHNKFTNTTFTVDVPKLTTYAKGDYILTHVSAFYDAAGVQNWIKTNIGDYTLYADDTKAYDNSTVAVYGVNENGSVQVGNQANDFTASADLVVVPFAKAGTIDSAVFSGQNSDRSIVTVNGTKTPVNCTYTLTGIFLNNNYVADDILLGKKATNFFVDQYGNVIGDSNVFAANYGIVDAAKWVNDGDLTATEYAQFALVDLDAKTSYVKVGAWGGKVTSGVSTTGMGIPGEATVSQNKANNAYYNNPDKNYGLVSYTVSDGVYSLTKVGTTFAINTIGAGQVKLADGVYANADTKFIVRTLDAAGNHVFKAYNGINEVPTMSNITAGVYVDGVGSYKALVYLIADNAIYAGSSVVAYVVDTGYEYAEFGDVYTYNVYIDGVKTPITVVGKTGENTNESIFTAVGLYKINFLTGDAKVSSVTPITDASWVTATIQNGTEGDGAFVTTTDGKGLNVTNAKIYAVNYHDMTVAETDAKALAATAGIVYKLVAGSEWMVETIYVTVG